MSDPRAASAITDAISTLAELQRRGYRHVLVSNNFPELWQVAEALGLAPYFSAHIVSAQVGWDKPSPEIFRLALEAAGNPKQAIMIGDNPVDDVGGGAGRRPAAQSSSMPERKPRWRRPAARR